ncbi:MAG: diphosphomevalonate decarboxylase [Planctomycetes bacterium]|nr:diphosphomevalonate decarboxylase [Planctomycetota bacterium]
MKSTAVAHANLAFVKYWGKVDSKLNIPTNGSISMNLSNAQTVTTVQFDEELEEDIIQEGEKQILNDSKFAKRVVKQLDIVRELAKTRSRAFISTENTFAKGVGIASSASGMAALTLAAVSALSLDLSEKDLSILARLGSGSACRSIPDGFVEWISLGKHEESYARSIANDDHWDLVDITVVVTQSEKAISSSEGHLLATNSPFFSTRLNNMTARLAKVKSAILDRDFLTFGQEIEKEAIELHAVAMTSSFTQKNTWISGIYYWNEETIKLIHKVQYWRSEGLPVYFTLDAGPTMHLITLSKYLPEVLSAIETFEQSQTIHVKWEKIINYPAKGARIID